jgi:hypothetical protein
MSLPVNADRRGGVAIPPPQSWPAAKPADPPAAWPPLHDRAAPALPLPAGGAWGGIKLKPGSDWPPGRVVRAPPRRPLAAAPVSSALERAVSAPVPLSPPRSSYVTPAFAVPSAPPSPHSPERQRAPRPRRPAPPARARAVRCLARALDAAAAAGDGGCLPPGAARGRLAAAALAPAPAPGQGETTLAALAPGSLSHDAIGALLASVAADLAALHATRALHRRVCGGAVFLRASSPSTARLAPPLPGGRLPPGGSPCVVDAKVCGAPHAAPEVARARADRAPYTAAGDVWALGATVAVALAQPGHPPLFAHPPALLAAAAADGRVDSLQAWVDAGLARCLGGGVPADAVALVGSMLRVDPGQRPSAVAVAARAWGCGGARTPPPPPLPPSPGRPSGLDRDTLAAMAALWPAGDRAGSTRPPRARRARDRGDADDGPLAWLSRLLPRQPPLQAAMQLG